MIQNNKVLFIIPFYNEENRINIKEFEKAFRAYGDIDFLLIDDFSADNTRLILEEFSVKFENVNVLANAKNLGKAESIRNGVLTANNNYNYLGYLDADLATPISEMTKLLEIILRRDEIKFIMGTRIKLLGNKVKRSLLRHYLGRIFATIISQFVLKIPIYDTQCGAKIIETSLAKKLFENPFYTRWLFDVELLLRYRKNDAHFEEKTMEVPLYEWVEKENTKIKSNEFAMVPFQIIKLYVRYR
ncbi:glycosyltransferase [Mesonia maritima]|uniref:Glycosyltransferase involved in cell wall biosynthesis n=1 Tax=Mesonia maritima TaxID=1793873 RepID=A0ABU1K9F1_9FLAO|nr:glycosyltransferase [Mesonia maritima]MDR6301213.1 glycosyltransferase involved in cell wall biosynthesis [Mesonia maritima]